MLFHVRHTIPLFFETLLDINKFYQHAEYVRRLHLLLHCDQQMRKLQSNYDNVLIRKLVNVLSLRLPSSESAELYTKFALYSQYVKLLQVR